MTVKWLDQLIRRLAGEHRAPVEAAQKQLPAEMEIIDAILSEPDADAAAEAWDAYRQGAAALDGTLRALIGYELAKRCPTAGQSGFHTKAEDPVLPAPFRWYDWIYWNDPRTGNRLGGTSFRIEPACFAGRSPVLYYTDDDGFPQDDAALDLMAQLSDGLCDFETVREDGKTYVHFRLADKAPEGYLLAVPRDGEFRCEAGEVAEGRRIPLHEDDFCMK